MKRREFVRAAAGGVLVVATSRLGAQQGVQPATVPMDATAHRPVKLPSRPGAQPLLNDDAVKEMERGLKCQCPCKLDLHTCYTTDVLCPVSPRMHADALALVSGGYSAEEIVNAFVDVYGERVRMAPKAEGFNLVAYILPFAAMGAGALLVGRWIAGNLRRQRELNTAPAIDIATNASSEELEELSRAMKDDR